MTTSNRWLLPEGIEELLPPEAENLEILRRAILDLFHGWGYQLVDPPLIEYLESLLVGAAYDLALETFTLTDQLSGRLMGIRADMTPQVARIDAHHIKADTPVRLCYLGTVLRTRPDGFLRTRSPTQVGAELYGHPGAESDAEVLCLMTELLGTVGLTEVHIDMGHVGIYRALARQAGLDDEQEQQLFRHLQRKAKPDIEEFLSRGSIDGATRRMLVGLVDMNGEDVLDGARGAFGSASPEVRAALDNLEWVAAQVRQRVPSLPVWYDLAELRGYRYQTGVVFAAYVAGHGQEIARGGRYDDIGREYGRARPATGFSADLKTLVTISPRVSTSIEPAAIFAPCSGDADLTALVAALRRQGERVIHQLPGQAGGPADMGCDRVIEHVDGRWVVNSLK